MKKTVKKILLGAMLGISLVVGGCSAPKDVTYFQEFDPGSIQEVVARTPFRIKPDDKLTIIVFTSDDQLTRLFNLGFVTSRASQTLPTSGTTARIKSFAAAPESYSAYTVSPAGTIDFPVLGELKVAGMTREELAGFIKGELEGRDLVQDPVVIVEYLNMGVNVIGEVRIPGRYDINANKMTVIDALSLAGDLNITGDREHVMVLRDQEDGKVAVYELDLTKGKEMLKSPAYYLQQGDVVYVEPNNMRKRSSTVNGNQALSASLWVSIASVLTSVAVLVFK
ncbi:MAG: polysaccharide export protein [Bacteroides sp.]|nr:polysaccharide export protein [Bacteroides sp.]MBD5336533.1 polysaccharide export protein [Bacteroides sp.]